MIKNVIFSVIILCLVGPLVQPQVVTKCEVCEEVLNKLKNTLPSDATPSEIEAELFYWCDTSATGQELKLCHYMGGTRTSLKPLIPEDFSVPMSRYIPSDQICRERLSKKSPQVCTLEYGNTEKRLSDAYTSTLDPRMLKLKDLWAVQVQLGLEDTSKLMENTEIVVNIGQPVKKSLSMPSKEL